MVRKLSSQEIRKRSRKHRKEGGGRGVGAVQTSCSQGEKENEEVFFLGGQERGRGEEDWGGYTPG